MPEREELAGRRRRAKHFHVGGSKYRCLCYQHDIHYRDSDGKYQDIDTTPTEKETFFENTTTPYIVRVSKEAIELVFTSRRGGTGRVELFTVGGEREFNIDITQKKNRIFYRDVVPDVDIELVLKPDGVEWYKILKGPDAATEFEWVLNNDVERHFGVRRRHEGRDAKNRKMELTQEIRERTVEGDNERLIVKETFTGRTTNIRDKANRIKKWVEEVEYPARIDLSIHVEASAGNQDAEDKVVYTGDLGSTGISEAVFGYDETFMYFGGGRTEETVDTRWSNFLHWPEIGLPADAVISAATVKIHLLSDSVGAGVPFKIRSRNDLAENWGIITDHPYFTGAPKTTASLTGTFTTADEDSDYTFDVKDILIEAFVAGGDEYWYTTYPMTMFLETNWANRTARVGAITATTGKLRVKVAAYENTATSNWVAGASAGGAVLDIVYTVGGAAAPLVGRGLTKSVLRASRRLVQ